MMITLHCSLPHRPGCPHTRAPLPALAQWHSESEGKEEWAGGTTGRDWWCHQNVLQT